MNNNSQRMSLSILLIFLCSLVVVAKNNNIKRKSKNFKSTPYLFNESSSKYKKYNRNRGNYNYSLLAPSTNTADTLKIIALRVEFLPDSSSITTGNGLFGIKRSNGDPHSSEDTKENGWYTDNSTYIYDRLPHDSIYFKQQLQFATDYFNNISHEKIVIEHEIYPKGKEQENAYTVSGNMIQYSPGGKKPQESWDEYYLRRTTALMKFIKDAIDTADTDKKYSSPFANIIVDSTNSSNIFYEIQPDSSRKRVTFLLIHAGASYLTDGGWNGNNGKNSPSDMIDAFISPTFFNYFSTDTTLNFDTSDGHVGVEVTGYNSQKIIVDELMMLSETSNQDSLNWGIHGILINQIARQLGIPDLFSTTSGISGVGGFCIMDFAGYSAGQGFIPPYPSAWIRAFMGWDKPIVISPQKKSTSIKLKAVNRSSETDTSMLLVPIADNEYYLIENRQRNLTGTNSVFNYDTSSDDKTLYISPYNHVNLSENVDSTYDNVRKVIQSVKNRDIGIPASGVTIWHIDENIIRNHLEYNLVNSDSTYRGINLVEADGITDLGVQFSDAFYQAAFDYGGPADIFPNLSGQDTVNFIGPFTRPSTTSNDGGKTYLTISVKPSAPTTDIERCMVNGNYVYNFPDSTFVITIGRDTSKKFTSFDNWPKQIIPSTYMEPVVSNIDKRDSKLELLLIDFTGRLYIWSDDTTTLYASQKEALPTHNYSGDLLFADTITYTLKLQPPVAMPTALSNSTVLIPLIDSTISAITSINDSSISIDTISIGVKPSTWITNYKNNLWAMGTENGSIIFGDSILLVNNQAIFNSPVSAIAKLDNNNNLVAIDNLGKIAITNNNNIIDTIRINEKELFPPFKIVTTSLEKNDNYDIIVSDKKQGIWRYTYDPKSKKVIKNSDWISSPNDWAGYYRIDTNRSAIPDNGSAPAIADVDKDGFADIIIGGTNGIYALNNRGVLLPGWPAVLSERDWYQRGSISSTPVIATNPADNKSLLLFSTQTGENLTFIATKIDSANIASGIVYFTKSNGISDSISDLTSSFIDSLITIGDSSIYPYETPGGYLDALNNSAKRPTRRVKLSNIGFEHQSDWPLTYGSPAATAPLLTDLDNNKLCDIISLSSGGWVYRWEADSSVMIPVIEWAQTGADNKRTFYYNSSNLNIMPSSLDNISYFYNRPNPVKAQNHTVFKYQLGNTASSVRLDIFTVTGYHIFSSSALPTAIGWNEYQVSLEKMGSAVYRCRLEVDYNGKKVVKKWKMAVIK